MKSVLLLVLFSITASLRAFGEDAPPTGTWIFDRRTEHIADSTTFVTLAKGGEGLELTFTVTSRNPSKKQIDSRQVQGPHRVKSISATDLVYMRNDKEVHVTIRLNPKGDLEWGALITTDNKTWRCARGDLFGAVADDAPAGVARGELSLTFHSDPFDVPFGEVTVPGLEAGGSFYTHERPAYPGLSDRKGKALRVLTRNKDKTLIEQFRMIWEEEEQGPRLMTHYAYEKDNLFRHFETRVCPPAPKAKE